MRATSVLALVARRGLYGARAGGFAGLGWPPAAGAMRAANPGTWAGGHGLAAATRPLGTLRAGPLAAAPADGRVPAPPASHSRAIAALKAVRPRMSGSPSHLLTLSRGFAAPRRPGGGGGGRGRRDPRAEDKPLLPPRNEEIAEALGGGGSSGGGGQQQRVSAPSPRRGYRGDVRVLLPEGEDEAFRVLPLVDALALASERELDLVLVTATATPPVTRLADWDKVVYESRRKAKAAARQAREQKKLADPKEVRLTARAEGHDAGLKLSQARKFLSEGYLVRLSVQFRGAREYEAGREAMLAALDDLQDAGCLKDPALPEKPFRGRWQVLLAPATPGDDV